MRDARGRGIATRLIDALLAHEPGRVHRLGRLACVTSFFRRRPRRQLVILDRPGRSTP